MPRVLIIEDEPGVQLAVKRWFERSGYDVRLASDGMEALAQLANLYDEEIDVILCDLNLPDISGDELLARLAKNRPVLATRFILCTGDATTNMEPDSLLARHPFVLQKPFDFAALESIVTRVRVATGDATDATIVAPPNAPTDALPNAATNAPTAASTDSPPPA